MKQIICIFLALTSCAFGQFGQSNVVGLTAGRVMVLGTGNNTVITLKAVTGTTGTLTFGSNGSLTYAGGTASGFGGGGTSGGVSAGGTVGQVQVHVAGGSLGGLNTTGSGSVVLGSAATVNTINIGNVDTTLSRSSAGFITIEGKPVVLMSAQQGGPLLIDDAITAGGSGGGLDGSVSVFNLDSSRHSLLESDRITFFGSTGTSLSIIVPDFSTLSELYYPIQSGTLLTSTGTTESGFAIGSGVSIGSGTASSTVLTFRALGTTGTITFTSAGRLTLAVGSAVGFASVGTSGSATMSIGSVISGSTPGYVLTVASGSLGQTTATGSGSVVFGTGATVSGLNISNVDTTISRSSAGFIAVEGNPVVLMGIAQPGGLYLDTDITVGGTSGSVDGAVNTYNSDGSRHSITSADRITYFSSTGTSFTINAPNVTVLRSIDYPDASGTLLLTSGTTEALFTLGSGTTRNLGLLSSGTIAPLAFGTGGSMALRGTLAGGSTSNSFFTTPYVSSGTIDNVQISGTLNGTPTNGTVSFANLAFTLPTGTTNMAGLLSGGTVSPTRFGTGGSMNLNGTLTSGTLGSNVIGSGSASTPIVMLPFAAAPSGLSFQNSTGTASGTFTAVDFTGAPQWALGAAGTLLTVNGTTSSGFTIGTGTTQVQGPLAIGTSSSSMAFLGSNTAAYVSVVSSSSGRAFFRFMDDGSTNPRLAFGTSSNNIQYTNSAGSFSVSAGWTMSGGATVSSGQATSLGGTLAVTGSSSIATTKYGTAGGVFTNLRSGTGGALVLGTGTYSDVGRTATSRYFVSPLTLGTVSVPSSMYVSSGTNGVGFTVLSSAPTDTSTIQWFAVEPTQ